jgi:hypothetical protein
MLRNQKLTTYDTPIVDAKIGDGPIAKKQEAELRQGKPHVPINKPRKDTLPSMVLARIIFFMEIALANQQGTKAVFHRHLANLFHFFHTNVVAAPGKIRVPFFKFQQHRLGKAGK